jgi:hypothetical protein
LIFLVSLVCPAGHPNGGAPHEYASENPPISWLETISRDLWRDIKDHPDEWAACSTCGVALNGDWGISVGSMKAATMAEAKAALDAMSTPPPAR